MDLNSALQSIEQRLATLGLPAGPDRLINHKTILGVCLGIVGAVIGWFITEPYREDFGFWRDYAILSAVGVLIWLLVASVDSVFDKSAKGFVWRLARCAYAPVVILAVVLGVKGLLAMGSGTAASGEVLRVFVLDVSGSMKGYPLETLKKAVRAYAKVLEEKGQSRSTKLACVTFSDKAQVVAEPTDNYAAFLRKIDAITVLNATNMTSGLEMARDVVNRFSVPSGGAGRAEAARSSDEPPRIEVILVSDGQPNLPRRHPQDAAYPYETLRANLPFFSESRVPIHSVGAGNDYDKKLLEEIAATTGGKFVPANDVSSLVQQLQQLARDSAMTKGYDDKAEKLPFFLRILSWVVVGIAIGLCCALSRITRRALVLGVIGGFAGGFLGALFFEAFLAGMNAVGIRSGVISRLGGFVILGACVGFCLPFVESVAKQAWIRITDGAKAGRMYILDRPEMILGRDELVDIPVYGDLEIDKENVRFVKTDGSNYMIEALGKDNLVVNGVKTRSAELRHGTAFTVGNTWFVYEEKKGT